MNIIIPKLCIVAAACHIGCHGSAAPPVRCWMPSAWPGPCPVEWLWRDCRRANAAVSVVLHLRYRSVTYIKLSIFLVMNNQYNTTSQRSVLICQGNLQLNISPISPTITFSSCHSGMKSALSLTLSKIICTSGPTTFPSWMLSIWP